MRKDNEERLIRTFIVHSNRVERFINKMLLYLAILLILSQLLLQSTVFRTVMNGVERLEGEKYDSISTFICEHHVCN